MIYWLGWVFLEIHHHRRGGVTRAVVEVYSIHTLRRVFRVWAMKRKIETVDDRQMAVERQS